MIGRIGFESWFRSVVSADDEVASSERGRASLRKWSRELYDTEGPIAGNLVGLRYVDAVVEVAEYLQDHVMEDLHGAWPVCTTHDAGAHAELWDAAAVLWCRRGEHAVAPIGET